MDAPIKKPVLYIVIPCYNEEKVLPETKPMFLKTLQDMIQENKISEDSRVLFVNDGSKDDTWNLIKEYAGEEKHILGLSLSRNRGHQNALFAGLMTAKEVADITISIDCDGQDDMAAMSEMVDEYLSGSQIVYGVRSERKTDTFFKRATAQGFYKVMAKMGADVIYNHADYRLMSREALEALAQFKEVHLFLRGMAPLVGFRYSCVYYERAERIAGESHYPLKKMLSFAFNGISSFSTKPIRMITGLGFLICVISLIAIVATIVQKLYGVTVGGWSSLLCCILFLGGIQLLSLGVIGEYVGKIYMETKERPRFIISEGTEGVTPAVDRR
ncbi:MAG: glycosyltransferase [Lachnospiraceae bacterium]|nr:glycosyltransferase [Lachnospiraceae bacterium]